MNDIIYIKISNLTIEIHTNYFDYILRKCKKYLIDKPSKIDISVPKRKVLEIKKNEFYYIFYYIMAQLIKFNRIALHSDVVEYKDKSYIFVAPSGSGKTTHVKLWKKMLGKKATIINADRPILMIENNKLFACGMPLCGKEYLGTNKVSQVKSIVFINKGTKNCIHKVDSKNYLGTILNRIEYLNNNNLQDILLFIDKMSNLVSFYELYCDVSEEAFKTSFETLTNEKY